MRLLVLLFGFEGDGGDCEGGMWRNELGEMKDFKGLEGELGGMCGVVYMYVGFETEILRVCSRLFYVITLCCFLDMKLVVT